MIYEMNYSDKQGSVDFNGHYNKCPRGWKKVTEKEFVESQTLGIPNFMEYRQVFVQNDYSPVPEGDTNFNHKWIDVYLFWHDQFHGYGISTDYWKKSVHFFTFETSGDEFKEILKEHVSAIQEDSGWNLNGHTSITYRGISDYDRTIKFEKDLSEDELKIVTGWLKNDKCPGYTGIYAKKIGDGLYLFKTTWDSSD